jgi:hypothetical protein
MQLKLYTTHNTSVTPAFCDSLTTITTHPKSDQNANEMLALKNKSAVAGGKLQSNAAQQQRAATRCAAAAPPRGAARSRRSAVAAAASKSGIGAGAAASSDPPARQAIAGFVSGIYRAAAAFAPADDALPPLWRSVIKLDPAGVADAIRSGADGAPMVDCV